MKLITQCEEKHLMLRIPQLFNKVASHMCEKANKTMYWRKQNSHQGHQSTKNLVKLYPKNTYILISHHFFCRNCCVYSSNSSLTDVDIKSETLESSQKEDCWYGEYTNNNHRYCNNEHPSWVIHFHHLSLERKKIHYNLLQRKKKNGLIYCF